MDEKQLEEKFKALREPFEPKWRVQSVTADRKHVVCVAYIDARSIHERLDMVLGAENWQNVYDAENGVTSLGIRVNGEWIYKSDVGTESNVEKIKGKASDSFKRAAVLWGLGRHLYTEGITTLDSDGKYPKTPKGQILYTGDQLTAYINGINQSTALLMQIVKKNSHLNERVEYQSLIKGLLEILQKEGN